MKKICRKPGRRIVPDSERFISIGVSLPPATLERLDALRGYTARSAIIALAVQEWLERQ